jgi:4-hydroxybenzoate polyprenyltransferase
MAETASIETAGAETEGVAFSVAEAPRATFIDHVAIMRLDHATKHVFILPGVVLALLLRGASARPTPWPIIAGGLTAILIASASYVIN